MTESRSGLRTSARNLDEPRGSKSRRSSRRRRFLAGIANWLRRNLDVEVARHECGWSSRTGAAVVQQILRMVRSNPNWGYRRIANALIEHGNTPQPRACKET